LRGLWPQRTREVASIAFLFVVYPGFAVQPIAWIHSLGYLIPLILFMFSLGAMIWAQRAPKLFWPLTTLAIVSSGLSMMAIEHFVGLELLRPMLLWLVLSEEVTSTRQRVRRTLTNWSPYLLVAGMFVTWRLFFFKTSVSFLDQSSYIKSIIANPLFAVQSRVRKAVADVIGSSLMAWVQSFRTDIFNFDSPNSRYLWIALGLVVVSAAVVILYLMRTEPKAEPEISAFPDARASWAKQAILIGLVAIILGGSPVWFMGRRVNFDVNSDANRYTLAMMFGACIFLVGLIQLIIKSQRQRIVLLGIITGLAVGFHFRNANRFANDWSTQRSLFWQLSWRVPDLKPGTSLLLDAPSSLFVPVDYALTVPVNFIYAPQHSSAQLDYWTFNLSRDLVEKIPQFADGVPLKRVWMNYLSFAGSTSHSLVVWFSPPSCLRVLDPQRDEIPQLPALTRAAQPLSHLDRILTNPNAQAKPPAEIFGREPAPCWCYYFEKADLARQVGNWQQVAQIGDEARQLGVKPEDPTELLLFVEAYAQVGRYPEAKETAEAALRTIPTEAGTDTIRSQTQNELALLIRPALGRLLKRLEDPESHNASRKAFITEIKAQLLCAGPELAAKVKDEVHP